jgi:hypothetical protein
MGRVVLSERGQKTVGAVSVGFNLIGGSSGQSVIVTRLERPSKVIIQFCRMSLPIKIA